jgi:hypothetical protein
MERSGADQSRRRRRIRRVPDADTEPGAVISDVADVGPADFGVVDTEAVSERNLRGLIGGGSSQVKPTVAMRARDAARPRDRDLAAAEAELVVIRRNWTPRD